MKTDKLEEAPCPRQVILFSGHMIDAPGRREPRFPPEKVDAATEAIAALLDEIGAGPDDLAFCGGACGGDLIFAEQVLKRGVALRVQIPFPEPEFLENSVRYAGGKWQDRFEAVVRHERCRLQVMSRELGPLPKEVEPFELNNLWLLDTALSWGPEKLCFMALWDGKEGDGPGGTQHMIETVRISSGKAYIIDINKL